MNDDLCVDIQVVMPSPISSYSIIVTDKKDVYNYNDHVLISAV